MGVISCLCSQHTETLGCAIDAADLVHDSLYSALVLQSHEALAHTNKLQDGVGHRADADKIRRCGHKLASPI